MIMHFTLHVPGKIVASLTSLLTMPLLHHKSATMEGFGQLLREIGVTCTQGHSHRLFQYYVMMSDAVAVPSKSANTGNDVPKERDSGKLVATSGQRGETEGKRDSSTGRDVDKIMLSAISGEKVI